MNASSNNANRGEWAARFVRQRSGMTMIFRLAMAAVASITVVALSGCSPVESCKRGEVGCIDGPVDALTQKCEAGLVPNSGGICVEPAKGECKCDPGQVCKKADNKCVNPCDLPTPLPVTKIQPGACRANLAEGEAQFDYMTTLTHACEQDCIRRQEYCGAPCDMSSCAPGGGRLGTFVAQATAAGCVGMVDCAAQLCERIRDRACAQYDCTQGGLGSGAPNCAGVVCSNSCPRFPLYLNDGLCDDGDLSNASSASCPWGADCGDCGPRRGAAPNMRYDYGDICVDPVQCGGDLSDVSKATGWCVRFDSTGLSSLKCVPDCSVSKQCRDGFTCKELVFETDDAGNTETLEDADGDAAWACFPMMCGN